MSVPMGDSVAVVLGLATRGCVVGMFAMTFLTVVAHRAHPVHRERRRDPVQCEQGGKKAMEKDPDHGRYRLHPPIAGFKPPERRAVGRGKRAGVVAGNVEHDRAAHRRDDIRCPKEQSVETRGGGPMMPIDVAGDPRT